MSPKISVITANYNASGHVTAAIRSVLNQTEPNLELIFSDDGSDDRSLAEAEAASGGDPRFRVVRGGPRSGPAATRNRALSVATGSWIAVVDSDDYIVPERFERMLKQAESDGADIAADDMQVFYENGAPSHRHLKGPLTREPGWISAADYARSNVLYGSAPALGYLKPMFRRERLGDMRYNESLRIAEDFDLVMRLLLSGARMRVYPEAGYFYRKHAQSISHRVTSAQVAAMRAAQDALGAPADAATQKAFAERRASLVTAEAFSDLVEALKARRIDSTLTIAARRPQALALLRYPIGAAFARLATKPKAK
ncbi:MAG: glycosyltransferase family 2 protein [Alphaproteobacteria bacterium]